VTDDDTTTCPHQEIIALYHEILPVLPKVRIWDNSRRKFLKTRWAEDKDRQSLDWWRKFFLDVAACPFLVGKGNTGWKADLEWLVRPKNFGKIMNGVYSNGNVSEPTLRLIPTEEFLAKEKACIDTQRQNKS
jgi:hypothetical protein